MNYYEILGVDRTASAEDIKAAFVKKAKKTHPDKNPTPEANNLFRAVHEAHKILSDPAKRAAYDLTLKPILEEKLTRAVEQNDLGTISQFILTEKQKKEWGWNRNHEKLLAPIVLQMILLNRTEMLNFLLKAGYYADEYIHEEGEKKSSQPLIYYAAKYNKLDIVKLLVKHHAAVKRDDFREEGNDAGIRAAIRAGHTDIIEYLLSNGASANGVFGNMRRDTFLGYAAKHDRIDIVELLLKHGATKSIESSFLLAEEKYSELIGNYVSALRNEYSDEEHDELIKKANTPSFMQSYYQEKLKEFNETKPKLQKKLEKYQHYYKKIIVTLFDYAQGVDFGSYNDLNFLKIFDNVSGINFVGVSKQGKPLTQALLEKEELFGADLIKITDIDQLANPTRKALLTKRIQQAMQEKGELIEEGIVNLIPLAKAAEIGDIKAVTARLNAGANPNKDNQQIPIELAALNGHEEIVDLFLTHSQFDTKLIPQAVKHAQYNKHDQIAEKLLAAQNINQVDEQGNTLLHYAVEAGKVAEVQKLIAKGADVNLLGQYGYPLTIAANHSFEKRRYSRNAPSAKHVEIIKILLANGANPNAVSYRQTAMEIAGCQGSVEALKLLLPITNKHDIVKENDKDKKHFYPWYTEIMFESFHTRDWQGIIEVLLAEGADINQVDTYHKETLLHLVARTFPSSSGIASTMRHLAEFYAGCEDRMPNNVVENSCRDALFSSQRYFSQHLSLFNFLLANGANPSLVEKHNDNTPIHDLLTKSSLYHIPNGYAQIIDQCLALGFDINSKNKYGETCLHIATGKGQFTAVEYLLNRGANINAKNNMGRTPLFYAAGGDPSGIIPEPCVEVFTYLLNAGADATIRDDKGLTAHLYAEALRRNWMQSESFKQWEYKTQREWEKSFNQLPHYANPSAKCINEKRDEYNEAMRLYLNPFEHQQTFTDLVGHLDIDQKDLAIVKLYYDETTKQLINIPVVLNARIYDLQTLLDIYQKDKKDPFTGHSFDLADIKPAPQIAKEQAYLVKYLSATYPAKPQQMDLEQTKNSVLSLLGLFNKAKDLKETEIVSHQSRNGLYY